MGTCFSAAIAPSTEDLFLTATDEKKIDLLFHSLKTSKNHDAYVHLKTVDHNQRNNAGKTLLELAVNDKDKAILEIVAESCKKNYQNKGPNLTTLTKAFASLNKTMIDDFLSGLENPSSEDEIVNNALNCGNPEVINAVINGTLIYSSKKEWTENILPKYTEYKANNAYDINGNPSINLMLVGINYDVVVDRLWVKLGAKSSEQDGSLVKERYPRRSVTLMDPIKEKSLSLEDSSVENTNSLTTLDLRSNRNAAPLLDTKLYTGL